MCTEEIGSKSERKGKRKGNAEPKNNKRGRKPTAIVILPLFRCHFTRNS